MDIQTNIRKAKDEIQFATVSAEEQLAVVAKLRAEISEFAEQLAEQERALANDGSRSELRSEIVAPSCSYTPESDRDVLAVRSLPRDISFTRGARR